MYFSLLERHVKTRKFKLINISFRRDRAEPVFSEKTKEIANINGESSDLLRYLKRKLIFGKKQHEDLTMEVLHKSFDYSKPYVT